MAMLTENVSAIETADALAARFGPLRLARLRFNSAGWQATEDDVISIHDHENRLCELIDGVLVEKTIGAYESYLALELSFVLRMFLSHHDLGIVLGPDAMMRLWPGRVRLPDVSFIAWDRLPSRKVPRTAMFDLAPTLAVEIISPGNTTHEMREKLDDYFTSGVELVWYVYPTKKEVHVFAAVDKCVVLPADSTLDGGNVLPGFSLELRALFAEHGPENGSS